jgi:hypothetical protein
MVETNQYFLIFVFIYLFLSEVLEISLLNYFYQVFESDVSFHIPSISFNFRPTHNPNSNKRIGFCIH